MNHSEFSPEDALSVEHTRGLSYLINSVDVLLKINNENTLYISQSYADLINSLIISSGINHEPIKSGHNKAKLINSICYLIVPKLCSAVLRRITFKELFGTIYSHTDHFAKVGQTGARRIIGHSKLIKLGLNKLAILKYKVSFKDNIIALNVDRTMYLYDHYVDCYDYIELKNAVLNHYNEYLSKYRVKCKFSNNPKEDDGCEYIEYAYSND